jgi:hypothetical protein
MQQAEFHGAQQTLLLTGGETGSVDTDFDVHQPSRAAAFRGGDAHFISSSGK